MSVMKLVRVIWRDIQTLEGGWLSPDEAIELGKKQFNNEYVTVGYLVERNPRFVLVAATISPDGQVNDTSFILSSVIIKIEKL